MNADATTEEIIAILRSRGDSQYGGEAITQLEHGLQAAALAEQAQSPPELIIAALLHDGGHMLHDLPDDTPNQGIDDHHEASGYRFLQKVFDGSVTGPVRLHVAAKRYLCAADADYSNQLSEPSRVSLALQGGPMSAEEAAEFETHPHYDAAVRLRRWDDLAKVPGGATPDLDHFAGYVRQLIGKG